jgi:hypothetical protein
VFAGDENRLTGNAGLPVAINPYVERFGTARPVAGAIRPSPGAYDVVFDTPARTAPGAFTFRFWIDDVTPPTVRLLGAAVKPRSRLELIVTDGGSGVDPSSLEASIDGRPAIVVFERGRALVSVGATPSGRHRLVFRASDYQELKNNENVSQILPNTRTLRATFRVR